MIDNGNMEDGVVYWARNEWCPDELMRFYFLLFFLYTEQSYKIWRW